MIGCHSVADRVRASRVVSNYSAYRGAVSGGRVGTESQAKFSGDPVEVRKDYARLYRCGTRFGIHIYNFIEVT